MENLATEEERLKGLDLADYLIKQDWRKFKPQPVSEISVKSEPLNKTFISQIKSVPEFEIQEPPPPEEPQQIWDIAELESFFTSIQPPADEIKLNEWTTITDINRFFKGHLYVVKVQNGKRTYLPYFNRLQDLKNYFDNNKN